MANQMNALRFNNSLLDGQANGESTCLALIEEEMSIHYRWKHGVLYLAPSLLLESLSWNWCIPSKHIAMKMQSLWSCFQKLSELYMIKMCLQKTLYSCGSRKVPMWKEGQSWSFNKLVSFFVFLFYILQLLATWNFVNTNRTVWGF